MLIGKHHFRFFGNKEITSLYITIGLISFGEGLISIFIPIYFWTIGFPFWKIILFYFLHSAYFLLLLASILPLMKRMSDKMMMFLSIPAIVLYLFGLSFIEEIPFLFYILPAFISLNLILFNVGYHMDFSKALDKDHVGREVGLRFTVGSLVQFAAPLTGGLLIASIGFHNTFIIGSCILFLSVIPLFLFPKRNLSSNLHLKSLLGFLTDKSLRPFTISGVGYASEVMVGRIVWPLFIFLTIGSIERFGGVMSFALLTGAIVAYLVGFLADVGKRRKVISWAGSILSLIWLSRPFFASPISVVGSHIGGTVANSGLIVAWSSQYYKIAKSIADSSLFILSREALYHITRVVFLPILMVLAYFLPITSFFRISFVLAGLLTLLILFANKLHTYNLDSFISSGGQEGENDYKKN